MPLWFANVALNLHLKQGVKESSLNFANTM